MKKLLLLSLAFCCLLPNASAYENYIHEGTTWVIQSSTDVTPEGVYSKACEVKINGTENIGGYEALRVVSGSKENFVTYLRTEGDRVYFSMDGTPDSWRLAYDFGLQPGETCEAFLIDDDWEVKYSVRCKRIYESPDNPGIELMDVEDTENHLVQVTWIRGLGSLSGLWEYILVGVAGIGRDLLQAWDGDNMVYLKPERIRLNKDMTWKTLVEPSEGEKYFETQRIKVNDGLMQLYTQTSQGDESLLCNLKVEDQQVYFSTVENPDEWLLCYDFNMRPGEKREFYSLADIRDGLRKVECECREIYLNSDDVRLSEMLLVNTQNPEIEYRWLRGLCSLDGFTYNVSDGPRDAQTALYEIKSGKSTIFSNKNVALESVETDAALDAPVVYYNLQGQRVSNPAPGLYIVRQGSRATKLLLP